MPEGVAGPSNLTFEEPGATASPDIRQPGTTSTSRRPRLRPDPHNKQMREILQQQMALMNKYIDFRMAMSTKMYNLLKEMVENQKRLIEIQEKEQERKDSEKRKGKQRKGKKRKHMSNDSDTDSIS